MTDSTPLPEVTDFHSLFLHDVPLLDVRAPVEFAQGAFPTAENLPLIGDDERHEIGIRYAELGQDAAVDLGHELVHGQLKARRVNAWRQFAETHPAGVLYCFRGGMRSRISQQWLYEQTGIRYPRVRGGYKALRRFLIERLETLSATIPFLRVGGRTGVGKTLLLQHLANALDLEKLAWHRGSAFGRHATPQPTQIDFENRLTIALLKHEARSDAPLVVEDEGKAIGSLHLPRVFHDHFKSAPMVVLEADLEQRISLTQAEYVDEALAEYQASHGKEEGFDQWAAYLLNSLERISRRLGGERHRQLRIAMEAAIACHRESADTCLHREWIRRLLTDYYDPMYDYQIARGEKRVVFRGGSDDLIDWISAQTKTA